MIRTKTAEEIEILRENALLVSKTLAEVGKHVAPGVTTMELDRIAEAFIRDHGAIPGFLGYGGFPYTLCVSVNDVVVHGFPSSYVLKEGDVVSVDCGTIYKGFYGDSAYTFPVGEVDAQTQKLLEVTKASLYKGIEKAVAGNRIGDIGYAIQSYCESFGFSVVVPTLALTGRPRSTHCKAPQEGQLVGARRRYRSLRSRYRNVLLDRSPARSRNFRPRR